MGNVTGVMLVLVAPKNKAISQSHSPIQFVLFNLHFGFWGTYNPYPQVQYDEIGDSLAHKKRVPRTHSNIKEWSGPVTLFNGEKFTLKKRNTPIFFFLHLGCISPGLLVSSASFLPGLFFFFHSQSSSVFKGTKHQALKMGKKNATTLETKFNITRQFITDTGFQVKANLNMTWCP